MRIGSRLTDKWSCMEVTHGNQSVVVQPQTDVNTLQFAIESDLDVKYTVPSPQLCDQEKLGLRPHDNTVRFYALTQHNEHLGNSRCD
jgi:hypothetical protein